MLSNKKSIAIIGGGASALSLASFLDGELFDVTIYERNKTLGRKFLVAGKGGFNLTHSEPILSMISKYSPIGFLDDALLGFDNEQFRKWLKYIGIPTYVGSSKRIFPEKGIKPIKVLSTIKESILSKGHNILCNNEWKGWSDTNNLLFGGESEIEADITVFCLGGGSWKVTGSDGSWTKQFANKGMNIKPFVPANCAYEVNWKSDFITKASGKPLKNIAIESLGHWVEGEAVITEFGIEGNAVYALTDQIQSQLNGNNIGLISIDLKPMISLSEIERRIANSRRKVTEILSNDLKLEKVKIQLLKSILTKDEFLDSKVLANKIKSLSIEVLKTEVTDKAISTTGGLALEEVGDKYQLNRMPNSYAIGEMLDWNAPTGGYLLQACFSMGNRLALHLNEKF
jgi:uncharacterized flavoprotein (TIGR03862 family)